MIIFASDTPNNTPGRVAVIPQLPGGQAGEVITITDWNDTLRLSAIITSMDITEACNTQFTPTLGNRIYADVFGDQATKLRFGGFVFSSVCGEDASSLSGTAKLRNWYRKMRVSQRKDPVMITIGSTEVYEGYLLSLHTQLSDARTNLHQFSMPFLAAKHSEYVRLADRQAGATYQQAGGTR